VNAPNQAVLGDSVLQERDEELLDDAVPLLTGDVNTTVKATAGEQKTLRPQSPHSVN
jgi:hypothetical protein